VTLERPWPTGKITNRGTAAVNLEGGWIIVPFSRGVHTELEGEWIRIEDPHADIKLYCWEAGRELHSSTSQLMLMLFCHINNPTYPTRGPGRKPGASLF
jgi:hypothetical protein